MSLPPKKAQENLYLTRRLEVQTCQSAAYLNQMKTSLALHYVVGGKETPLDDSFSLYLYLRRFA
jgi:hypothetical protein